MAKKIACREGLGNLPNRSDPLTDEEVEELFNCSVTGEQSPMAITNAMAVFLFYMVRRMMNYIAIALVM